jgi:hypothetical protein
MTDVYKIKNIEDGIENVENRIGNVEDAKK